MIKNERIRIYPASREQMEKFLASETDEELKKAYSEMLEGPRYIRIAADEMSLRDATASRQGAEAPHKLRRK